jgi:hypothetical protein
MLATNQNSRCKTPTWRESHPAEKATVMMRDLPALVLQRGRRVAGELNSNYTEKSTEYFPALVNLTYHDVWLILAFMKVLSEKEAAWVRLMGNPYAVLALTDIEEAEEPKPSVLALREGEEPESQNRSCDHT